ncbi:MAG: choice-of-anchor D domain-containing protein [Myxococcaceae bacterium]|nr:choice-of-anchor D domain-containing protein [Myxococcaceae bacterium]
MNTQRTWRWWAVAGLSVAFLHCGCESKTSKRLPKLEILADEGNVERTLVDFGLVQVNLTHTQTLRVRNGGTGDMTLTTATLAAPFAVATALPLTLSAGDEVALALTFTPTQLDQRVTGKLTLTSDDSQRASASVDVAGTGVAAVAKVTPSPIAWENVYVGESKKLNVSLTNAGSQALTVLDAKLSASVSQVSGDWAPFKGTLEAGASAMVELTFSPTVSGPMAGDLELTLEASQGGLVKIPLTGQGVSAVPKLCFQFDDTGMEQCTDLTTMSMNIGFGAFCDETVFGNDGGALACSAMNSGRSGRFRVRNEGNWPVSYAMTLNPFPYPGSPCKDAGFSGRTDFVFSVADDGGTATVPLPVVQLPMNVTDAKPWASEPVAVSYHARSRCKDEGSDQATVLWSRRGDPVGTSRMPSTFFVTLGGKSKLPHGEPSAWGCGSPTSGASVPCEAEFFGVTNSGDAPLVVRQVDFYEEVLVSGVDGGGPQGGFLQPCDFSNPFSDCQRFGWAATDGGDPNQYAPHVIAASAGPSAPGKQVLGRVVFGPHGAGCLTDGGVCPGTPYRIYAKVTTADPYQPDVWVPLTGTAL